MVWLYAVRLEQPPVVHWAGMTSKVIAELRDHADSSLYVAPGERREVVIRWKRAANGAQSGSRRGKEVRSHKPVARRACSGTSASVRCWKSTWMDVTAAGETLVVVLDMPRT